MNWSFTSYVIQHYRLIGDNFVHEAFCHGDTLSCDVQTKVIYHQTSVVYSSGSTLAVKRMWFRARIKIDNKNVSHGFSFILEATCPLNVTVEIAMKRMEMATANIHSSAALGPLQTSIQKKETFWGFGVDHESL